MMIDVYVSSSLHFVDVISTCNDHICMSIYMGIDIVANVDTDT